MKFVDVFQFFNCLLEEMSRCNCFSLQLVGGRLVGRKLEPKGEVCPCPRKELIVSENNGRNVLGADGTIWVEHSTFIMTYSEVHFFP